MKFSRFFFLTLSLAASLCLEGKTPVDVPFSEVPGVSVGNASDDSAKTGVTVFFFPEPAYAGVTVLGGGPASRETEIIGTERNVHTINALVFAGGSSFGLEASHGVMEVLEKRGIGYDTGAAIVPIVCQSDIYDLTYGSSTVRPDKKMGAEACLDALEGNHPISGNAGAGVGATIGKPCGMARACKSGIGYAAAKLGNLYVGAAAVVNAYGDVYSGGKKIGGMTDETRKGWADASDAMYRMQPEDLLVGSDKQNTTLVVVFTNADLLTADLKKVANMASAGLARCIRPVFTMSDGDTVYAVSTGSGKVDAANVSIVGALAADVVESAIRDAVLSGRVSEKEYLGNIRHQ